MSLELEDENDNAPVFIQSHFEIYINENESTFPYRFRVEAFDRDLNGLLSCLCSSSFSVSIELEKFDLGSANSRLEYSIIDGGDAQGNFTVDPNTGEIGVAHPLDFELLAPSVL